MLTRSMYEPIHQNLLDYQTEQMKSTADSMGSSFGGFSGGGAGGGGGGSWYEMSFRVMSPRNLVGVVHLHFLGNM